MAGHADGWKAGRDLSSNVVGIAQQMRASCQGLHSRENGMSKVRVAGFSVSVDGFGAGPEQSMEYPLGKGGPDLFGFFSRPRPSGARKGGGGGSTGPDDVFARRS